MPSIRDCGGAFGDEDRRRLPEAAGDPRHRPAVVAVGRRHEAERAELLGDDVGQLGPRRPLRLEPDLLDERPVGRPRGTEGLERREPEALGLGLDEQPAHADGAGDVGELDQGRRLVPGQAPVELEHPGRRGRLRRHRRGSVVQQEATHPSHARMWERVAGERGGVTRFVLNGSDVEVGVHDHLLDALREELGVTSPKDGCAPSGQCGCCTVLVDGKATIACNVELAKVEGKSVTTLEGLDPAERDRYAAAFGATGALQCGFCTPGIVMRAKYLLEKEGAGLTREKAARHLGGHLCRCTGYHPILDAVDLLATGAEVHVEAPTGVGSRSVKYEAAALAMGDKPYVDDLRVPGMLHGAVTLAEHARADVLAIDSTEAAAVPGVVRVLTAADVPGELKIGLIHRDWPVFIPVGGRTSYLGDVLALVVADTKAAARRAAGLVRVDYAPLRPIVDAVAAVDDPDDAVWGLDGNVLSRSTYARGDVDAALAASAHVVTETFDTQRIEHAFLEPESTLAVPHPDGTLEVYSGGQGVWDDRRQIADVLGVPEDRVIVHLVANGGAFGGKEDCANQTQTALAAWLLQAPVKCTLSREESLLLHPKRHPLHIEATAGCDDAGRLTALRFRAVGDSGPYASVGMKVLERAAGHAGGPYVWPTIDVEAVAARTNNPIAGAFRGFGANQAQFATEGLLDRLAAAVGIDGWEMRSRNVIMPGELWGPGQVMDDGCLGARDCLDEIKPRYDASIAAGKAVGLGLGLKNSGLGNGFVEVAKAVVRFEPDGTVEVRHCWTEMGQGVHTVALQVAVDVLGIDPDRIRVVVDTTRELGAGQTTGQPRHPDGRRLRGRGVRGGARRRLSCRRRLRGRAPHRLDPHARHRRAADHPLGLRLRGPARRDRPRHRRHRRGRRRPRRRPGGEPVAVRGPGPRVGAHGARVRAHRGLPRRCRRTADGDDAAPAGHPPPQGRPAHRRRARRTARSRARRTASRASARSGWCPPPAPSPPPSTTSTASGGRRYRCADDGDDAGARLRPSPPLLDARARHAGAALDADGLPGDPRAGVVAPRRRPRSRPPAVVGSARRRRGPRVRHDGDRRPPRVTERDRRQPRRHRRGVRRGRRPRGVRLRRHRPPRRRTVPSRAWPRTSAS